MPHRLIPFFRAKRAICLMMIPLFISSCPVLAQPINTSPSRPVAIQENRSGDERASQLDGIPSLELSPQQWSALENATDQALAFLARQQRDNGEFPSRDTGQPAVTSLCVMAYLGRGHLPGKGKYGNVIDRGINFVLDNQHPDGIFSKQYPSMPVFPNNPSQTGMYNHAISCLMLSEVYGMTTGEQNRRIKKGIINAIGYSRRIQLGHKKWEGDKGGWRYVKPWPVSDSDLSVTSWQLMHLRSARNAGFDVPLEYIDEAMAYVDRCYEPQEGVFLYALYGENRHSSRAMTGAGILAMSLGGRHQSEPARRAGDWVLRHPFTAYNRPESQHDRYFYGAFYCTQAMFQLGGEHWSRFFPPLMTTLLRHQQPDGSWHPEVGNDAQFMNSYTTALSVLALSTPYQLLPIFQR